MLENTYGVLERKLHDRTKAWDRLIEFIAVDNYAPLFFQLNHKFEWFFEDSQLAKELIDVYDIDLLRSDYYDHLGEMYIEKLLNKSEVQLKGIYLTPMEVGKLMANVTIEDTDKKINILDPAVGTGRLLMAAHKQAPKARLFGVDTDLRVLRIAYTNLAIHNIQGYLLHADSLRHEIDISTKSGRENWHYANNWYSQIDKLKVKSERIEPDLFTK